MLVQTVVSKFINKLSIVSKKIQALKLENYSLRTVNPFD